jgi:hypothetical protein
MLSGEQRQPAGMIFNEVFGLRKVITPVTMLIKVVIAK